MSLTTVRPARSLTLIDLSHWNASLGLEHQARVHYSKAGNLDQLVAEARQVAYTLFRAAPTCRDSFLHKPVGIETTVLGDGPRQLEMISLLGEHGFLHPPLRLYQTLYFLRFWYYGIGHDYKLYTAHAGNLTNEGYEQLNLISPPEMLRTLTLVDQYLDQTMAAIIKFWDLNQPVSLPIDSDLDGGFLEEIDVDFDTDTDDDDDLEFEDVVVTRAEADRAMLELFYDYINQVEPESDYLIAQAEANPINFFHRLKWGQASHLRQCGFDSLREHLRPIDFPSFIYDEPAGELYLPELHRELFTDNGAIRLRPITHP